MVCPLTSKCTVRKLLNLLIVATSYGNPPFSFPSEPCSFFKGSAVVLPFVFFQTLVDTITPFKTHLIYEVQGFSGPLVAQVLVVSSQDQFSHAGTVAGALSTDISCLGTETFEELFTCN